MWYLADCLTLIRFILSLVLGVLAIYNGAPELALVIFLIAGLTDAFDGTCAKKWPMPKNKQPRYRRYAAKYDMISDILLAATQVLFLTLQVNFGTGLVIIIYYLISSIGGDLIVYGKVLGHPDDCTKNALIRKNFRLAKKIIIVRRYLYVLCLVIVSILILLVTDWSDIIKYSVLTIGCLLIVLGWFFLKQRRQNISRDAVELEEKMTKKKSPK